MNLLLVGTNHKSTQIGIREKLSFPRRRLKQALASLVEQGWIQGGVIISTCNRIELYATVADPGMGIESLKNFLSLHSGENPGSIEPYLYIYRDKEAALHLFEVTSGLDSQIIGESQILDQVKYAWEQAKIIQASDRFLDSLFREAIRTSLRVRQETGISSGDFSFAQIILELISVKCGPVKDKRILILGAGSISELITRRLKESQAQTVFIANKTFQRAKQLADGINAQALRFDKLGEKLERAEVIISTTASPHYILKKEDLLNIRNPLLIIDLALPRDVDPQVGDIPGITLFNLDGLNSIIRESLGERRQEIPKAQRIINQEVESLCLIESSRLAQEPAGLP